MAGEGSGRCFSLIAILAVFLAGRAIAVRRFITAHFAETAMSVVARRRGD